MASKLPLTLNERRNQLYLKTLQGGSPSALVMDHMQEHCIELGDAEEDWDTVLARLRLDASITQEVELARVRASRWQVIEDAHRRGQYMACSTLLKDIGFAAGEQRMLDSLVAESSPVLTVRIEGRPTAESSNGEMGLNVLPPAD